MDQARLHAASRKQVDLGNEPPLSVDGGGLIHRRVSIQWFSGTVLTGLCGAALMGGAVFASLDRETTFAMAPERIEAAPHGAPSKDRLAGNRKTDRLPVAAASTVEHRPLRVPTVSRRQDQEMVRVRPYERVFGKLSLTVSDLSADIPAFNPQQILAEAVSGHDESAAAPQPDAEVSFSTCDLAAPPHGGKNGQATCALGALLPKVKPSSQLPPDEVMERVRELAKASGTRRLAEASGGSPMRLSYASDSDLGADLGFAARIVPENLTLAPKTRPNTAPAANERVMTAKRGETVGMLLDDLGTTPDLIRRILAVLGPAVSDNPLNEGQHVRVLLAPPLLGRVLPERVVVDGDGAVKAAAALSDMNTYVPVDISNIDAESDDHPPQQQSADAGATLYQSLWETALQNNVPRPVIEELVRIYAYDVDFQRKVQPGDTFDVLYSQDANGDGTHEIRYASLRVGGETQAFYHFRTSDDGQYDYYDATGKSAKKFLVRKPVSAGMETSPFGWRINPLLHINEMHTGVDWAAPLGSPIFAAGDGTIEQIGPRGGYGKYIRIRHADGYETAYGHMIAFARGLDVGSRVRQGQVIGFVGSTGLSTGAHVHFEIWVNGRVVDPMRIKLPRGRVLEGATLAEFEGDCKQLNTIMANGTTARVAQMR